MNLLVDLGNSRLKWAWSDASGLAVGEPVDHSRPLDPELAVAWADAPRVTRALVASVARPRLEAELAQAIHARLGVMPEFVTSRSAACGVRIAYARPEKLGVDRFLALIALHAQARSARGETDFGETDFGENVVLASVGTALVLDGLAADGRHLGGLIAPSPMLMQEALLGATARVSASAAARIAEAADDTEDAVRSGCWLAAASLVERFHSHCAEAFGALPVLALAGGAARELAPLVRVPSRIEPDLVLRGLAVVAGETP